jgi:hypothetical protein
MRGQVMALESHYQFGNAGHKTHLLLEEIAAYGGK